MVGWCWSWWCVGVGVLWMAGGRMEKECRERVRVMALVRGDVDSLALPCGALAAHWPRRGACGALSAVVLGSSWGTPSMSTSTLERTF